MTISPFAHPTPFRPTPSIVSALEDLADIICTCHESRQPIQKIKPSRFILEAVNISDYMRKELYDMGDMLKFPLHISDENTERGIYWLTGTVQKIVSKLYFSYPESKDYLFQNLLKQKRMDIIDVLNTYNPQEAIILRLPLNEYLLVNPARAIKQGQYNIYRIRPNQVA